MNNQREIILVVDDNHQLADFVAYKLLPSLGYQAQTAYTGKSALEMIRSSRPALILLDLELPDTTGLDILRKLTNEGYNIPTILVTAHGSEQIAVDAFRLGVQDYLVKPVDLEKLQSAISRALTETHLRQETNRLNSQLREQVNWLNALSKIGKSLASTLDLDEVLRRIVEAGVQLTQAEEGFLALLDRSNGRLHIRAAKNIDESMIKTMHLPVDDELISKVVQTGRPVRVSSEREGATVKVSTGFLVADLLHVPIFSKGQLLGVLSVVNRSNKRVFLQTDETMLTSLADYAAAALENAGLYQQAQREITERKRIEQALRESEERYALAVRGANDGLWDWDLKTNRTYFSPRWKAMLGHTEDEIGNDSSEWFNRVHRQDVEKLKLALSSHIRGSTPHFEGEYRMKHKDGTYRWMLSRGWAVRGEDGVAYRMAGSQTDISARKTAEAKLLYDAFYDNLTGLPNRALFMDHLNSAIERTRRREGYQYAVLFLDLDQFKNINDSLGHPVGDQLLVAVSNMLKSNIRATDTVARLGGDEFVILLDDIHDESAAARVSELILRKLASPIRLAENEVFISTSIGIVLSTIGYHKPEDVLRDADIAMYAAKARGKANYEVFKPAMRERIMKRMSLETDLRQAIEEGQLVVHYQPIISIKTGQVAGFEALVRWQHPERGLVLPADFIALAQETGLILPIDQWVIETACRQISEWQSCFHFDPPLMVNVNLTGNFIVQPNLPKMIKGILSKTGLEAKYLSVDVTESAFVEFGESFTDIVAALRNSGVEVQIDDFGTGYSSLVNLKKFPVSALKIDQIFVSQMSARDDNTQIVRTIIELAHDLGMQAYAEGIETERQLRMLKSMGCDGGQGYLFARPLEPGTITEMFENAGTAGHPLASWKTMVTQPS